MTNLKDKTNNKMKTQKTQKTLEKMFDLVKPLFLRKEELINFYTEKGDFEKAAKTAVKTLKKMRNSNNYSNNELIGMQRLAIENYAKAGDFENAFNMEEMYYDGCRGIVKKCMDDYLTAGDSENILKVARGVDRVDPAHGNDYLKKAVDHFKKSGDFENAAKAAESNERAINVCERANHFAARIAKEYGLTERANKLYNRAIDNYEEKGNFCIAADIAKEAGFTKKAKKLYHEAEKAKRAQENDIFSQYYLHLQTPSAAKRIDWGI